MIFALLTLIHVSVCIALIFFVLIQSNKGMGLSGAFGAMGGESVFGTSGGVNLLMKITISLAVIFAITSLALSFVQPSSQQGGIMAQQADQPTGTSTLQNLLDESKEEGNADAQLPAAQTGQMQAAPEQAAGAQTLPNQPASTGADAIQSQPLPNQPVPNQAVGVSDQPAAGQAAPAQPQQ